MFEKIFGPVFPVELFLSRRGRNRSFGHQIWQVVIAVKSSNFFDQIGGDGNIFVSPRRDFGDDGWNLEP